MYLNFVRKQSCSPTPQGRIPAISGPDILPGKARGGALRGLLGDFIISRLHTLKIEHPANRPTGKEF